jgi:PST family polysaccharide transporter
MAIANSGAVIPQGTLVPAKGDTRVPIAQGNIQTTDPNLQHFATDHLLADLKERAISSSFVTITAQGIQFVLMFLSTVVLARLLSPSDFGLVAMVLTIMSFVRIFNEAGLSTATVQREGITHTQVSNLFWTNILLGGTMTLLLCALAPAIAWFYREPRLVSVALALCATFLLTSSAVQHLALLKRQMQFKKIALIQVSAATTGVLIGLTMAWLKFGYWSLVGMQLGTPTVSALLAWSISDWRPQFPRRDRDTRSLLHFGAHLTVSSFLWSLARGSDGLLIGRLFGSASLGLYSRASALLIRPIEQLLPPIEAVFVPTLARLQIHPERYRRTFLKVFEIIAVASFLFTGLLLALARPVTLAILGPKWEEAAPIFAGFTFVVLYAPLGSVSTWLLTSQARGKMFLRLSIVSSTATVIAFLIGLRYGPAGVAVAFSISCLLIVMPIQYYLIGRHGPVRTCDLWKAFLTHLPIWVVVSLATFLVRTLVWNFGPWKQLAVCVPIGLLAGIAFIAAYPPARRAAWNLFQALKELSASK